MLKKLVLLLFALLSLNSCIVQSPKYTSLEKVISLKLGMTKDEVEEKLGVAPYDLKAKTDSSLIYIYVYRLNDRKTISLNTKTSNGKEVLGRYQQLMVSYSESYTVVGIESCTTCPDNLVNTKKIDVQKIIVFVTITLPVILVYIGLK